MHLTRRFRRPTCSTETWRKGISRRRHPTTTTKTSTWQRRPRTRGMGEAQSEVMTAKMAGTPGTNFTPYNCTRTRADSSNDREYKLWKHHPRRSAEEQGPSICGWEQSLPQVHARSYRRARPQHHHPVLYSMTRGEEGPCKRLQEAARRPGAEITRILTARARQPRARHQRAASPTPWRKKERQRQRERESPGRLRYK